MRLTPTTLEQCGVDVQPVLSHTRQDLLELWSGPPTPTHVGRLQVLLPTRVQPRQCTAAATAWTATASPHRCAHPERVVTRFRASLSGHADGDGACRATDEELRGHQVAAAD